MKRQGTVTRSERLKQWALIRPAGGGEKALAFFRDVENDTSLAAGDVVSYEEMRDAKGLRAIRVRRWRA